MSFVMAAMSSLLRRRLQSCSKSAVLPEPTGPPTPMRRGCSAPVMQRTLGSSHGLSFRKWSRLWRQAAMRVTPIAAPIGSPDIGDTRLGVLMLCFERGDERVLGLDGEREGAVSKSEPNCEFTSHAASVDDVRHHRLPRDQMSF